MPRRASARRFAQAAFQIALERDALDDWAGDLGAMSAAMEDPDLLGLLDAPHAPMGRKADAITAVLGDAVDPLAANLLGLLASRNLAHLTPGVADEYVALLDAQRGVERADVVTAVELNDAQAARLKEVLRSVVGKDVEISSTVEPAIIGGMVARVGDRVIDGSTRSKLEELRKQVGRG